MKPWLRREDTDAICEVVVCQLCPCVLDDREHREALHLLLRVVNVIVGGAVIRDRKERVEASEN